MPRPESIVVTSASVNDFTLFKQEWSNLSERAFFEQLYYKNKSEMLTPVKYAKGTSETIKQFKRACDDLYFRVVSTIRQPMEFPSIKSFKNRILEILKD